MPARTPRRSFAAPFIVTLAACGSSPAPAVKSSPAPSTPIDAATATANGAVANRWSIDLRPDGCRATGELACPPNVPCGAPPSTPYPCPADRQLVYPVVVIRAPSGCEVVFEQFPCLTGRSCNPPSPIAVPCPQ